MFGEKYDVSYGVVPLRKVNNQYEILLVKSRRNDYFSLPKGHKNRRDKSFIATAIRELLEETGHIPTLFGSQEGGIVDPSSASPIEPVKYTYQQHTGRFIHKTVIFYMAEVTMQTDIQDKREIELIQWFPLNNETASLLHHDENIRHFLDFIMPNIPSSQNLN